MDSFGASSDSLELKWRTRPASRDSNNAIFRLRADIQAHLELLTKLTIGSGLKYNLYQQAKSRRVKPACRQAGSQKLNQFEGFILNKKIPRELPRGIFVLRDIMAWFC